MYVCQVLATDCLQSINYSTGVLISISCAKCIELNVTFAIDCLQGNSTGVTDMHIL